MAQEVQMDIEVTAPSLRCALELAHVNVRPSASGKIAAAKPSRPDVPVHRKGSHNRSVRISTAAAVISISSVRTLIRRT